MAAKFRVERDPLGEVRVPAGAYYGGQTARAVENFPISGLTAPPALVTATVLIKKAAAEANASLGRLEPSSGPAPSSRAADEVLAGKLRDQFVVDVYQAGAGTSHNMNANEVLANRAAELLGGQRGSYERDPPERSRQHGPVDQRRVPDGDATGDALRPARICWRRRRGLVGPPRGEEPRVRGVLKTGRTHLQDAVPITLGQEFGGYAANVAHGGRRTRAHGRRSCTS